MWHGIYVQYHESQLPRVICRNYMNNGDSITTNGLSINKMILHEKRRLDMQQILQSDYIVDVDNSYKRPINC